MTCRLNLRIWLWAIALCLALAGLASSVGAEPARMGITEEQKDQLKSLAAETKTKSMRERGVLMAARRGLARAYSSFDLDERLAKAAIERIGKSQLNLLNAHLENQIALRRILSEPQLNELWNRMSRKTGGREGMFVPGIEEAMGERLPSKETLTAVGLSEDQQQRLRQSGNWQQRAKTIGRLRADTKQLLAIYSKYDLDADAARKLIDSIHQSQTDLAAMNHKMQLAIRSVLTKAQFDRIEQERDKRFSGRQGRRPFKR